MSNVAVFPGDLNSLLKSIDIRTFNDAIRSGFIESTIYNLVGKGNEYPVYQAVSSTLDVRFPFVNRLARNSNVSLSAQGGYVLREMSPVFGAEQVQLANNAWSLNFGSKFNLQSYNADLNVVNEGIKMIFDSMSSTINIQLLTHLVCGAYKNLHAFEEVYSDDTGMKELIRTINDVATMQTLRNTNRAPNYTRVYMSGIDKTVDEFYANVNFNTFFNGSTVDDNGMTSMVLDDIKVIARTGKLKNVKESPIAPIKASRPGKSSISIKTSVAIRDVNGSVEANLKPNSIYDESVEKFAMCQYVFLCDPAVAKQLNRDPILVQTQSARAVFDKDLQMNSIYGHDFVCEYQGIGIIVVNDLVNFRFASADGNSLIAHSIFMGRSALLHGIGEELIVTALYDNSPDRPLKVSGIAKYGFSNILINSYTDLPKPELSIMHVFSTIQ